MSETLHAQGQLDELVKIGKRTNELLEWIGGELVDFNFKLDRIETAVDYIWGSIPQQRPRSRY